jgi:hypothetical protein
MKWTFGRMLEILGLTIIPVGLMAALLNWNSSNAMKYELYCMIAGLGIFYLGNTLRKGAENR